MILFEESGSDTDVEIEKLPKIGEPLSIKTCKQGRVGSLNKAIYGKTAGDYTKDWRDPSRAKKKSQPHKSTEEMILTAKTISTHKKSTAKEKEFALKFIEMIKNDDGNVEAYHVIKRIRNRLLRLR